MPSPRNSDRRLRLPALLIVVLALVGARATAEPGPFLQPGQKAPNCTLQDLAGQPTRFPVPGRWNVVFFWSLFCHICLEEMPQMVADLKALPGSPCESFFVTLDTVKMKKGLTNFVTKRRLDCRLLLEEIASDSYRTADVWGVKTTPSTFLVDPSGQVVFSREGPFPMEELFVQLRALPGAAIAPGTVSNPVSASHDTIGSSPSTAPQGTTGSAPAASAATAAAEPATVPGPATGPSPATATGSPTLASPSDAVSPPSPAPASVSPTPPASGSPSETAATGSERP